MESGSGASGAGGKKRSVGWLDAGLSVSSLVHIDYMSLTHRSLGDANQN